MSHTALVTGASRGLGLEFVKQYAQDQWNVIACCRQPTQAKELQALSIDYPSVKIIKLDVCNDKEISQLAKILSGIPIDILINNAGILGKAYTSIETVSKKEMMEVFLTNAIGPLQIAKVLLPNLTLGALKTIVNISSQLGSITFNTQKIDPSLTTPYKGYYAYRASKVALNMLMKTLSLEWYSKGIRILLLHPGWVKTDMSGPRAILDTTVSVKELRKVIIEKSSLDDAMYHTFEGEELPW